MTRYEFISLVKQPDLVTTEHLADLKELVEMYPYFAPVRLFHAKALQKSNSILFASNLQFSSLYTANRRWLYYYIYPEKKAVSIPYKREKMTKSSGGYFDMMNVVESEGGDTKQSLKNLAARLKSARTMVVGPQEPAQSGEPERADVVFVPKVAVLPDVMTENIETDSKDYFGVERAGYSENDVKELIKQRKYNEAVEILKLLNLNNPKKSVYFADQIRFLEKVIANSKK